MTFNVSSELQKKTTLDSAPAAISTEWLTCGSGWTALRSDDMTSRSPRQHMSFGRCRALVLLALHRISARKPVGKWAIGCLQLKVIRTSAQSEQFMIIRPAYTRTSWQTKHKKPDHRYTLYTAWHNIHFYVICLSTIFVHIALFVLNKCNYSLKVSKV